MDYGKAAYALLQAGRVKEMQRDPAGRLFIEAVAAAQRDGTAINIHCAIDSLTATRSYVDELRPLLQATLGDGGLGWLAFNNTITTQEGVSFGITAGGGGGAQRTVANFDPSGTPLSIYNPSLYWVQFAGASGGSVDTNDKLHAFTEATVYYVKQSGGGTFNWRDGNTATNPISVDTSGTTALAWSTRTGWPDQKNNLVRASSVTGNVHIIGADLRRGTGGCRVHRTAQPSVKMRQVAQLDGDSYTAFLEQTGCDLYILNGGMNDAPNGTDEQYEDDVRTVLTWVRAANPQAAILLLLPNDTDNAERNTALQTYRRKLQDVIAPEFSAMVFDERYVLGSYAQAVAAGLMIDGIHPNAIGSSRRAEAIYRFLGGSALRDAGAAMTS